MERAVATDPDFSKGMVLPVIRQTCTLPASLRSATPLSGPDPLWLSMENDRPSEAWRQLLAACKAALGTDAPLWLDVRDQVVRFLQRGQSVNLIVGGHVQWRGLLDHLRTEHLPDLALVNLEKGVTVRRRGLINEILRRLGYRSALAEEPDDLAELDRLLCAGPRVRVALTHFDLVGTRPHYGVDFFAVLRNLVMDERKLVLLIQSRTPFAGLLPRDHPLSEIDIKTVELRGTS